MTGWRTEQAYQNCNWDSGEKLENNDNDSLMFQELQASDREGLHSANSENDLLSASCRENWALAKNQNPAAKHPAKHSS